MICSLRSFFRCLAFFGLGAAQYDSFIRDCSGTTIIDIQSEAFLPVFIGLDENLRHVRFEAVNLLRRESRDEYACGSHNDCFRHDFHLSLSIPASIRRLKFFLFPASVVCLKKNSLCPECTVRRYKKPGRRKHCSSFFQC